MPDIEEVDGANDDMSALSASNLADIDDPRFTPHIEHQSHLCTLDMASFLRAVCVGNSATGEWYLSAQQGSKTLGPKTLTAFGTCPVARYFLTTDDRSASRIVGRHQSFTFTFDFQYGDGVYDFIAAHGLRTQLDKMIDDGVNKVIQASLAKQQALLARIQSIELRGFGGSA
ncbi:hypothetical protein LTR08_002489 [Meristemomyces frigidus]|nr:hypothetical protein LTR08_002489 [Meristemomyces frigidus]